MAAATAAGSELVIPSRLVAAARGIVVQRGVWVYLEPSASKRQDGPVDVCQRQRNFSLAEPLGAETTWPEEPLASLGRPDGILAPSQSASDNYVLPLQARRVARHARICGDTGLSGSPYLSLYLYGQSIDFLPKPPMELPTGSAASGMLPWRALPPWQPKHPFPPRFWGAACEGLLEGRPSVSSRIGA